MIDTVDTTGLICGFRLQPDEPAQLLTWETVAKDRDALDGPVWLHFNLADTRAQKWIQSWERLPEVARGRFLDDDSHIRLQVVERGAVGVLGDVLYEFNADPERLGTLRIYVDEGLLITGRVHPLKAIDQLRQEMRGGEPIGTTVELVAHLVEDLADMFSHVVEEQGEIVDDIEDGILKEHWHLQSGELGRLRRLFARLRRHVGASRHVLSQLLYFPAAWRGGREQGQLQVAVERLEGVVQDFESIQERARLLQEEIATQRGESTSRNLYVLSILTAILLPITLITGIFGMNVGGLPWVASPNGFGWVMFVMMLTGLVTFGVLMWRRFF
ncbi:MAG TPA: CorA family divalent cation transporter [Chthoniobacterales bacterium]